MKKYIALFVICFSVVAYSQDTPGEYTIDNAKVNTKFSDFGTSFFGENKVIFASPKDDIVITRKTWSGNNQPFLDLYIGIIDKDGRIINKKKITGDVNNKYHEGVVAFTKDLKTVYFSANNYTEKHKAKKDSTGMVNIQLYKATLSGEGEWNNVIKLPFNSDEFSTGHPALNKDDTKLYFVSDRLGSIGKTDIFVVDINEDGTYSEPKNLGDKINTEKREMFPFISGDNILYFSSNGHPGYGGLDVFASKIFDSSVSDPINLENPVNSLKDDFAFIINDAIDKGYFSSNRANGKGDDDIYSFISFPPINIEGKQVVSGIILDKETLKLIPEATVILLDKDGVELEQKKVTIDAFKEKPSLNTETNIETSEGAGPDIYIVKSVDNPVPEAGEEVEFTIEVTNKGTDTATAIKIADILPEGYRYVSDDSINKYKSETDVLMLPFLAEGATKVIKIKAITPSAIVAKESRKNVSAVSGDIKNIHIERKVSNLFPQANEEVVFTIEVENKGTSEITGINVSDILPEGYTYVTDDAEGNYKSETGILTVPTLAKGKKTTIKIKAITPVDKRNQDGRKSITAITGEVSNVKINRSVSNLFPQANEEVVFTIEVENKGTSEITGINVSDILPEGYTYVTDDAEGNYKSETDILTVPTLAKGEKTTIKIKAITPVEKLNQDNRKNVKAITGEVSNVEINRNVSNLFPQANEEVEFTIEVTNKGTSAVTGIDVIDILPKGYTYVTDDANGKYQSKVDVLTLPTLAEGEKVIIKIKATSPSNDLNQEHRKNVSSVSGDVKNIQVERKVGNLFPQANEEVAFTIKVTNKGTRKVKGIKISDILPKGYVYVSDDSDETYQPNVDMLVLPKLGKGEEKTIIIKALAPSNNLNQREREKVTSIGGKVSDIRVNKRIDNLFPKVNEEVEFTVEVENRGTSTATGVKVSDILPKGYEYIRDDAVGVYRADTDVLVFSKLAEGEKRVIKIKARVTKNFTTEDDAFNFEVKSDTDYKIVVEAPGFMSGEADFKTANETDTNLDVPIQLVPELRITNDKVMVNINTIYFDYGKSNIRPDAAKELEKVIAVMKEHPSLTIEAGSHTDSRSREAFNLRLSKRRAKSTHDYIVAGGINPSRIIYKGYGEMQLANNCSSFVKCTEAEHQLNRRTEFVVTNDNQKFNSASKEVSGVSDKIKEDVVSPPIGNNTVITNDSIVGTSQFVKFKPVYYKFDAWSLADDELVQIDNVIQTMQQNPKLIIQVNVHTDAKNIESYNQKFSDKRAKSIVDYMLSKGIASNRISGKGYGESILSNHCSSFVKCSKEKQQANRRIEFMVVAGNGYPETKTIEKYGNVNYMNHNPIYFDFDKFSVRQDAAYELDRIVNLMKENQNLKIVAESHTDSQNLETYNQVLSEKRANATKNYIVSKGVNPDRIRIKGFGEIRLTNQCSSFVKCTPEEHQANRRTEFRILKM